MTRDVFEQFVAALRYSYEQRMPGEDILSFWFSKVSFIPEDALEYCRDVIKKENPQYFPKHFHDKLVAIFYEWRRAFDPAGTRSGCPRCDLGWIYKTEISALYDYPLPVVYACESCNAGITERPWRDKGDHKLCRILSA